MCSDPITKDHKTFACRVCNECIATRRHGWVARAMAEKADHRYSLCLALTYSDDTAHGRDAARFFCYADVSAFMKKLRQAAHVYAKKHRLNVDPGIRFLCAGEQGDRNGRCHWHMILYSNLDLRALGEMTLRGRAVSRFEDMMTVGKRKRRLNWSIWTYGFVTLQEPDLGGMHYVLSYSLKDQFTAQKSKGTMREDKSENFATGLFRMSKRPAIGENWLMRKLEELAEKGAVLPALNLRIPGFKGYWQPSGSFRKKLLWGLRALNQRALFTTGSNAPQWAALVASCADNEHDMGILNGTFEQDDLQDFGEEIREKAKRSALEQTERDIRARCGAAVPCADCLSYLDDSQLATIGVERVTDPHTFEAVYVAAAGSERISARRATYTGRRHPFCRGDQARFVLPGPSA